MSADDINIVTNILNDENRRLIEATTQEVSTDYSSTCNENASSEKESYCSVTSPIGTVSPNADTFHTTQSWTWWCWVFFKKISPEYFEQTIELWSVLVETTCPKTSFQLCYSRVRQRLPGRQLRRPTHPHRRKSSSSCKKRLKISNPYKNISTSIEE